MNVANGGLWGYGDILLLEGIDVMPMYFTITEMEDYLKELLLGKYIEREGHYYPAGRLASVDTIQILTEKENTWSNMKQLVQIYPKELFQKQYEYHMAVAWEEEDISRVRLRKEVLFYHWVLEDTVDHLLQAIFALNDSYFPSRKRTEKYLKTFQRVPTNCYERMIQIIQDAADSSTICASVDELEQLVKEVRELGKEKFSM